MDKIAAVHPMDLLNVQGVMTQGNINALLYCASSQELLRLYETHKHNGMPFFGTDKLIGDAHRILDNKYIPTLRDCILSRVKTTGLVETEVFLHNIGFSLIDVGGARNERSMTDNNLMLDRKMGAYFG